MASLIPAPLPNFTVSPPTDIGASSFPFFPPFSANYLPFFFARPKYTRADTTQWSITRPHLVFFLIWPFGVAHDFTPSSSPSHCFHLDSFHKMNFVGTRDLTFSPAAGQHAVFPLAVPPTPVFSPHLVLSNRNDFWRLISSPPYTFILQLDPFFPGVHPGGFPIAL